MPRVVLPGPMNIDELHGDVLLRARNHRARERELLELIRKMLNDRDLEPGMYRVDVVRVGDEKYAEVWEGEVLALAPNEERCPKCKLRSHSDHERDSSYTCEGHDDEEPEQGVEP